MSQSVISVVAIAAAMASAGGCCREAQVPAWKIEGIPAVAYASKAPLSAARWIWAGPRCTKQQAVCFRHRFEMPQAEAISLQIRADDIIDGIYLNGETISVWHGQVSSEDLSKSVRKGENVLALKIRNGSQVAGVIYRVLRACDKVPVAASSASVRCVDAIGVAKGWYRPDFDDAEWTPAYEHGDVTMPPWSRHALEFVRSFMTDAEWSNYQETLKTSVTGLPASLASEPEPDARIVYRGWLPKIALNGKDLEPNFALPLAIDLSPYPGSNALKLHSLGFPVIRVAANDGSFLNDDGSLDFSDLDWQARRLLTMIPDARMEINLVLDAMHPWCRRHPNETVGYATGPADPGATETLSHRVLRPSAASETFREEISRIVAAFGAFVRAQPWGKRAIAVRVSYGIYTEWHAYAMAEGPDTGAAMTKAFRRYLTRKYGDDAALAKAWNDQSATLGTAAVPTMKERGPTIEILDPQTHQKSIDFFDCNVDVMADLLLHFAHQVKVALPGRLVGAYYGYVLGTVPTEGLNDRVDKVLASPDVDYLTNPPSYGSEHRRAGGAFTMRNIPATYHRYGKLCLCEDDMRYHHAYRYDVDVSYGVRTPEESKATAKRNYLNRLFDGIGIQALDLTSGCRPGAFDDPVVLGAYYEAIVETAAAGDPGLVSGNELAVVIDYRAKTRMGNRPGDKRNLQIRYRLAPESFYRTGMTFDLMTLDDYVATKQDYSRVLFLNPVEADATLMAKARAKAGAGAHDFDCRLTTVRQYRKLFEDLGLHAWTAPENYVRRHGDLFMFHTGKVGRHEIVLPAGRTGAASISTGRDYTGPRIVLEAAGPMTELFRLK